jgi:anti-sigma factor RsiW
MKRQDNHKSCVWVEERIDSYLDGDLVSNELACLEDHLGTCAYCQSEVALARNVLEGLHDLPQMTCPDEIRDQVLEHARTADGPSVRRYLHDASERARKSAVAGWLDRVTRGVTRAGFGMRPALTGALAVVIIVASIVAVRINRTVEHFSPEQVESAESVLRWTFAYMNEVGRKSGYAARDEVFEASATAQRAVRSALTTDANQQPEEDNGGSI